MVMMVTASEKPGDSTWLAAALARMAALASVWLGHTMAKGERPSPITSPPPPNMLRLEDLVMELGGDDGDALGREPDVGGHEACADEGGT